jgi:Trk K+ transport system NAD-binding subunit
MRKIFRALERIILLVASGPYVLLKRVWVQLLIIALMFFVGAAVFHHFQGLDWLTALLGSVSTVTTIGLYSPNIVAMANPEKILLIIIIVASVGSAASLLQTLISAVTKKEFFMSRLDGVRVSTMNNHIIVMGYSFLGKYVAEKLKEMGMEYVVVAKDEEQAEIARNNGITAMSSPINLVYDALKKAGIERAGSLVATYDDDGDNMLSIMVAKQLNPKIRTITIINERELREGAKAAKADVVIAPSDIIGNILATATSSNEIVGAFLPGRFGGKNIAEFTITKEGLNNGAIEQVAPLLLIIRAGESFPNKGKDFALETGDQIYVLADHNGIVKMRKLVQ